MTRVATWPSSFSDLLLASNQNGSFGKMCPACIPLGAMRRTLLRVNMAGDWPRELDNLEGGLALKDSRRSAIGQLKKLLKPTILTNSSAAWSNSATGSPQQFLTLNLPDWRNNGSVCSLSDILEDAGSVPQRYYLTKQACAGILRRADRMGKELPPGLHQALEQVADGQNEPGIAGAKTA